MDEERLYYIEPSDPLFHAKSVSIQSHNQIVDLIKENKKGMHDKLYYIFSLYIAIITGLYFQLALTYLSFFIISNVFLILPIYPAWKFYFKRRDLAKEKYKIEDTLNEFGIPLA